MRKKMAKRKRINIIVENCGECPYAEYNSYYSMSRDSGYDCSHYKAPNDNRIVDDGGPYRARVWPQIPDWCPLKDA
jgi:hypothetical protein